MLNSDNTRGYLISGALPPVCGVGRGAALPSGPFYPVVPAETAVTPFLLQLLELDVFEVHGSCRGSAGCLPNLAMIVLLRWIG